MLLHLLKKKKEVCCWIIFVKLNKIWEILGGIEEQKSLFEGASHFIFFPDRVNT